MKKKYIASILVILLLVVVLAYLNRPFDDCITIEGIKVGIQNSSVLAKVSDFYYETSASTDFSAVFQFENWKTVSTLPEGAPVLTLQLAELWIIEFYDNGFVAAYNGYSAIGKKASAYYDVGEAVAGQIVSYLQQNGVPHKMGDGTISQATFNRQ